MIKLNCAVSKLQNKAILNLLEVLNCAVIAKLAMCYSVFHQINASEV